MSAAALPTILLNNGVKMPLLGLGVYDMHGKAAEEAVTTALRLGYRLIDTAAMYGNEASVGIAIRNAGVPRNEIFVTTKLNNHQLVYASALRAFDDSLKLLGLDYIDLYLIHWPIKGQRKESWLALEQIYASGRAKAIGVANYHQPLLGELKSYASVTPAVNQVEFSPWLYQKSLLDYCRQQNIQLQAYSPITRGIKFQEPRLQALCLKYGKSAAQLVLRWHLQHGISAIPKSANASRLKENSSITDFSIEEADMEIMNSFHDNFRICDDPADYF